MGRERVGRIENRKGLEGKERWEGWVGKGRGLGREGWDGIRARVRLRGM